MIYAQFEGRCRGCGEFIEVGDEIHLRDETWLCSACAGLYDDAERALERNAAYVQATHRGTKSFAENRWKRRHRRRT